MTSVYNTEFLRRRAIFDWGFIATYVAKSTYQLSIASKAVYSVKSIDRKNDYMLVLPTQRADSIDIREGKARVYAADTNAQVEILSRRNREKRKKNEERLHC